MNRPAALTQLLVRTVAPLLLGLTAGGVIIWALGANPITFFADIFRVGVLGEGWQQSLTAMAPLLLISLGLIVAFRAQLWNLSGAGTYLLAAAVVAGLGPALMQWLPFGLAVFVLCALAVAVGAMLGLVPAWLKAARGTNEVITSLMVSFVAIGLTGLLVKGPFQDPGVSVPQTRVLDLSSMLPYIPGTRVHVGLLGALALVAIMHVVLTRTAFGLRIDVLGANPRAAVHAGINVKRLIVVVFMLSCGLIALGAALDMLGLWGYLRAGWNPAHADKILPFVFLARLNPLGSVPLVAFYAVLATGGTIAAQRAGLSVDVLLVIVAMILFFMTIVELLGRRERGGGRLGASYLPRGILAGGAR